MFCDTYSQPSKIHVHKLSCSIVYIPTETQKILTNLRKILAPDLGPYSISADAIVKMPLVQNLLSLAGIHRDLTVGVEFEFFLAQHRSQEDQISNANNDPKILPFGMEELDAFRSVKYHMSAVLPNDQYRVVVVNDPDEFFPLEPESEQESSAALFLWLSRGYEYYKRTWEVKGDGTLGDTGELTLDPRYAWVPIEITTAILKPRNALRLFQDVFDRAIKPNFLAGVNRTANLHIHVGQGDQGFSEKTVKKLATILWLGEARINEFWKTCESHVKFSSWARPFWTTMIGLEKEADHLNAGSSGHYHAWLEEPIVKALREHSYKKPEQRCVNIQYRLKALWDADGLHAVCELLLCLPDPGIPGCFSRGEFAAAYNFMNLLRNRSESPWTGADSQIKNTIEFRKPAATLKPEVAAAWCHIFVKLVAFARDSDRTTFGKVVSRLFRSHIVYSLEDLLKDVGCDEDQVRLLRHRTAESYANYEGSRTNQSPEGGGEEREPGSDNSSAYDMLAVTAALSGITLEHPAGSSHHPQEQHAHEQPRGRGQPGRRYWVPEFPDDDG